METTLNELIKEGNEINNGIYADNGGGLYATFSFKDHNKYIKWAINSIRFIETNFQKDENYDKFKTIVENIDKNLIPGEFNKLLFILEYYNSIANEMPSSLSQSQVLDDLFDCIKAELNEVQFNYLKTIITEEKDIEKSKLMVIEKLNSFGDDIPSKILTKILFNPTIKNKLLAL
ncbi:MAG: hypothetical protein PHD62_06125 [Bacteroidales bacterium]|nr:hypothetical protein [Bacteroidales bacterium]